MKKLLIILGLSLGLATTAARAEVFFIAIQLDMQMGVGLYLDDSARRVRNNNTERVMQYMIGKKFDSLRDCEMYLLEDKRGSGNMMEHYADHLGMGLVWNNYASDNTTIVQQWRCLKVNVLSFQ